MVAVCGREELTEGLLERGELVRVDLGRRDGVDDVEALSERSWRLPVRPLKDSNQGGEEAEAQCTCDPVNRILQPAPEALAQLLAV